jgi:hypothetical protein
MIEAVAKVQGWGSACMRLDLMQVEPVRVIERGGGGRGTAAAQAACCCAARGRVGARKMTQDEGCQHRKL